MRRTTYVLFGVLLTLGTTIWAADIDFAGNPQTRDGSLWARKSGTTNTKQDITSTNNALNVNVAGSSGTTTVAGGDADNAANSTTKLPVIPCRANAAAPSWTEGREVPCSVDLTGYERVLDEADYAQGSTTSGQLGPLAQGAVTTAAPTYTTGQTSPLSLTTAGALRTSVANLPTTVDTGNGATSASTPRVTISNDSTGLIGVQGNVASGVAVTANPLLNGGRASTATPSAVGADGNAVALWLTRTGAAVVSGQVASGSALVGNPVLIAGSDGTNARSISTDAAGGVAPSVQAQSIADAVSDSAGKYVATGAGSPITFSVRTWLFNNTNWDRARDATIGNNVASTGIATAAPYGQYNTLANQPALTTGNYGAGQLDSVGNAKFTMGAPAVANILFGYQSFTSTTGATTLVTITAGKSVAALKLSSSVSCAEAAAATVSCQANVTFTTVGAGITPAAGTIFACDAKGGANAATGTVGSQGNNACQFELPVSCASGTCTIAVASTNAGTSSLATAAASGVQQ